MKWILWREYRLNRLILITAAVIMVIPYLFVLIALVWPDGPSFSGRNAANGFVGASLGSLAISQLTIALLGGNAIAGERADRSAEFLAYLPLPRIRRLWGKLIMALSTVIIICGINLAMLGFLHLIVPNIGPIFGDPESRNRGLLLFGSTGLALYGVSWLISSLQSSSTFAIFGGLVTPLFVIGGIQAVTWRLGITNDDAFIEYGYPGICLPLAAVSFTIGTRYYLTRVEP